MDWPPSCLHGCLDIDELSSTENLYLRQTPKGFIKLGVNLHSTLSFILEDKSQIFEQIYIAKVVSTWIKK